MTRRRSPLRLSLVAALAVPWGTADAADPALDEVVVTARRHPEPLSSVPLSLDVVARTEIGVGGVDSLGALAARVPGLYFESLWGGIGSAPVLRSQSQPSAAGDNVGVFVDGVYQATRNAIDVEPFDLERIEVVRGPQSALFGHSTFAGAIHYVSRRPTTAPERGIALHAGSDQLRGGEAYWSGPLPVANVLGRIAVLHRQAEGTHRNAADDDAPLGSARRQAVALALEQRSDAGASWRLNARLTRLDAGHPASGSIGAAQYDCGSRDPANGLWSYYCGDLPRASSFRLSADLPDSRTDIAQASLELEMPLGGFTLESVSTVYTGRAQTVRDFDGSDAGELFGVCTLGSNCPVPLSGPQPVSRYVRVDAMQRGQTRTTELLQDIRLRSSNSPPSVDWWLGLSAYRTRERGSSAIGAERGDLSATERLTAILPATPEIAGPLSQANQALVADPRVAQVVQSASATERRTLAVYGAVDWSPVPGLDLRAEARRTIERLALDSQASAFRPGFGRRIAPLRFHDVTPRISIAYRAGDRVGAYLSAAKGSRSGGINAVVGLAPEEQGYGPEYNWTYELGGRAASSDGRVSGAVTAFYIDWRDTHIIGFSNVGAGATLITRNTAGVVTRGVEGSIAVELRRGVTLSGSGSFTDPQFRAGSDDAGSTVFCGLVDGRTSSFCPGGPPRDGSPAVGRVVAYVDGNRPQRAPTVQWRARLRGEPPPVWGWEPFVEVDYSVQDDVYDRAVNGAYFGARRLLDARAGIRRGPWTVQLWGRNLTDERYLRSASPRGPLYYPTTPRPLDLLVAEGRRFGIIVRYDR